MPSSSHRAALVGDLLVCGVPMVGLKEEKETANLRGTLVRPLFSSGPDPGAAEGDEGSAPLDPRGGTGRAFSVWVVEIGGNEVRATAPLPAEAWGECGDEVEIEGEWVEHPRYGRQISVLSVRPWIPRDAVGVAKWLEQRPGVGPVTAAKVLRGLDLPGPEALEKIRRDPSCLDALDLPENRRAALVEAARAYFVEGKRAEVLSWCYRYGLGPARAAAVWSAYGEKAPAEISADPWGALGRLDGFGFLLADDVARRLGVDAAAESRLKAAVIYALSEAASGEGHVYLPEKELVRRAMTTLAQAAKSTGYGAGRGPECLAALPRALEALALEGLVELMDIGDDARACYLSWLRRAEEMVREWLSLRGVPGVPMVGLKLADSAVRGPLDEAQVNAVRTVISSPAAALTGPPGTGKTTVTKAVVAALEKCGVARESILLAAPTGRAAKRMAEVTLHKAVTIHRLLGYNPGLGVFSRNGRNPLDGEFLVVDEASMVDLPLMASLLEAVPEEMGVIFVGDADQLPPVGPGAPFHEIVRRRILPVATLEKIYRQGDGGTIAANAKRVNGGQAPAPVPGDPSYRQKTYPRPPRNLSQKEREAARERVRRQIAADVLDEVRGFLERGYRPDEIQVLTPTKRSSVGTAALNAALRPVLNPDGERRGVFKHGAVEFRVGDRVMHLVNDRAKGVYNGEIGTVVKILYPEDLVAGPEDIYYKGLKDERLEDALWPRSLPAGFAVRYEAGDGIRVVEYTREDCRDVALAFASTVHKAQGCEFPAVVFVVTWDSFLLLKRNMLYTGLSRARKEVVVLAEEGTLERAAAAADDAKRYQKLV